MEKQTDVVERIMDYDSCSNTDIDAVAEEILRLRKEVSSLRKERAELLSYAVESEWLGWRPAEDGDEGCWYYKSCGKTLGEKGKSWGKATEYIEKEKESS